MAQKNINAVVMIRNDLIANYQSANKVYAKGEILIVWDGGTTRVKYGDGVTAFNALPYHGDGVNVPLASASVDGLMSKQDFSKLAGIAAGANANVIEAITLNGVQLVVTDKGVSFSVPTTVAELTDAGDYAEKSTTLSGYGIADAYTKSEVDAKVTSVFRLKGTVATVNDLATVASPDAGDVYLVLADGSEYVYDGTQWEKFGVVVDLSAYYTRAEVDAGFVAKNGTDRLMTAAEGVKLAGVSDNANKVEQSTTNGNVKIDGVETTVYALPASVLDENDTFIINGGSA